MVVIIHRLFLAEASLKINTFIDLMFLCDYYRPLSEHLVSMVFSYWRSSAELEDLFSKFMKVT